MNVRAATGTCLLKTQKGHELISVAAEDKHDTLQLRMWCLHKGISLEFFCQKKNNAENTVVKTEWLIDRSSHAYHKYSAGKEIGHRLFAVNSVRELSWKNQHLKISNLQAEIRRQGGFVISSEQAMIRQHVFSQAVPIVGTQKRPIVRITKIN